MTTALPANTEQHFAVLLDTNGKALARLLAILKQEKAVLEEKDYKAYQTILAKKQEELPKLAKLDNELKNLLAQAGLGFDKEAIHEMLEKMPSGIGQALLAKWNKLLQLLKECNHLNLVNQRIVSHTKQSNDRLLSLIKGEAVHSKTYSAAGKASSYSNTERYLARA